MKPINMTKILAAEERYHDLVWEKEFYEKRGELPAGLMAEYNAADEELCNQLERLDPYIAEAEGKARERKLSPSEIVWVLRTVTKELDIPKSKMVGIRLDADIHAQEFPRSYYLHGYTAESTHFLAEYKTTGWVVTDIFRDRTRSKTQKLILSLTDEAKQALLDRFQYRLL